MKNTITVDLPPALMRWVDQQLAEGQKRSEFLEQILRKEQRTRLLRKQIDANLQEALASGPSTPLTAADFERIRREGRKRVLNKQKGRGRKSS